MDANTQKALSDKLYDRRKGGALELETQIRNAVSANDHARIEKIVDQLCNDYAFAVHQPHARNGGLIGLAAASIALGPEVARYLQKIVPPVLACFDDTDARVRYYACESMYNIAKVAKGEILLYFNQIFDALCKLAGDPELSVKNGAELLDRLVKDIVSESASSYVSVLHLPDDVAIADSDSARLGLDPDLPTAFSLARFIPLLQEKIDAFNPFVRTFLVSWLTLLDSIPDLELVTYLPSFLRGLLKFLSDDNQDVHNATQTALERFLTEIKKIARINRGIAESRKSQLEYGMKRSSSSVKSERTGRSVRTDKSTKSIPESQREALRADSEAAESTSVVDDESAANDEKPDSADGDWVPGQDVEIDYPKILEILLSFLSESLEEEIQLTALRWIESFFEICAEDILLFVPRLLSQVLPAMASNVDQVRQAANRVNSSLMDYIMSLADEPPKQALQASVDSMAQLPPAGVGGVPPAAVAALRDANSGSGRESPVSTRQRKTASADLDYERKKLEQKDSQPQEPKTLPPTPPEDGSTSPKQPRNIDYEAAVNALTLQFLNEHEATRVAALQWLIMIHRKSPRKMLAINDGTFPALLKTLSDPAESVVTRDLLLLSQISKHSDDSYFTSFMVNLLKLFCTDRRLLETRGNLIIRQLCVSLSAERIYRTMADCLERDEDVEFASIMVQNLNNNLITAPELADLRRRLRHHLDGGQAQGSLFVTLFRAWCHNAVATFSLCLLAQAYEPAYHLLQIFADQIELTVSILIQIDKLVQLLESPVFTALRLQLLEPERHPYLYKCLYGLLMLLPQSSAFAALKNRLQSVAAIGYLHAPPHVTTTPTTSFRSSAPNTPALVSSAASTATAGGPSTPFDAAPAPQSGPRNRLAKSRDDSAAAAALRWAELLDKFKAVQERARRAQQRARGLAADDAFEYGGATADTGRGGGAAGGGGVVPGASANGGPGADGAGGAVPVEPGRLGRSSTVAAMGGGLADARGQLRPLGAAGGGGVGRAPLALGGQQGQGAGLGGGGNQAGGEGKGAGGGGFAKGRSGLSQLGRIAGGVGGRNKGKK
ncbi:MAG: hypothetical protein M1822_004227 [Bathelium mastoideum]|nr:MAG: hypothetical protein M1822_004227 [Bathelium mastoideum]